MVPKAKAAGPWAPRIPVGFFHWLACVSGTLPEAVPDVAGRACVSVYIDAYAIPSVCTHPCMRMSRNASLPDLSALGVPLKATRWRWDTEIRIAGHRHVHAVTRLSPAVGIQAVVMSCRWTLLSVSLGTNLLKCREGFVQTLSRKKFYLFVSAVDICLDVMVCGISRGFWKPSNKMYWMLLRQPIIVILSIYVKSWVSRINELAVACHLHCPIIFPWIIPFQSSGSRKDEQCHYRQGEQGEPFLGWGPFFFFPDSTTSLWSSDFFFCFDALWHENEGIRRCYGIWSQYVL